MSAERTEAYRRLIAMLLTYPNQAAKILNKNSTLLDAGLMEMMQQVASQMAVGQSQEAADFLKSLIAQLKDELTMATGRIKITQPLNSDRLGEFSIEIEEKKGRNLVEGTHFTRPTYNQSDKEKIHYLNSKNIYLNHLKKSQNERDCYEYAWSKWIALAILLGTLGLVFINPLAKLSEELFGQLSEQLNFFDTKSQNYQE